MAIQDLINEVNSIQTKKQAIKDAITAKGVTSEGKLSKFADEIKQITTKEPDWYIVNKFRYENGNEALLVRTSDKDAINAEKYQMVEIGGGVTRDNSINSSFDTSYNNEFGITNGTYFPRESAYRSFTTKDGSNIVFNGHNDNLKLTLQNGKEIVFRDVNTYNWLKGYRSQPLADYNTLYLKSDGFSDNTVKSLSDFLSPANTSTTLTLGTYGATPILLIDSSIMVQAMNLRKMSRVGFISYSDKEVDTISLTPVSYTNTYLYAKFYNDKEQWYGNLSPGNYVHLFKSGYSLIVFVSVNYVVDSNGQKHKNIEVYIYSIQIDNSRVYNKPFELYLTFFSRAQQELQEASNLKLFRRKVLKANGTPEPRTSNFLTGNDALLVVNASKLTDYSKAPSRTNTTNTFKKESSYVFSGSYKYLDFIGAYISDGLADDASSERKIKGFIRLNDDSNTMFPIELEQVALEAIPDIRVDSYSRTSAFIAPNGTANNNKMLVSITDYSKSKITCFYVKKGNAYITNDWLSSTAKNTQLYLTSDAETQKYLTTKSLTDIWTEINSLNKEDFDAYTEN